MAPPEATLVGGHPTGAAGTMRTDATAVVGEEHVAIGTDFSLNRPRPGPWQEWANKDKGTARVLTGFATAKISKPKGIQRMDEFPNLTAEMLARHWSEARVKSILGGNWLRLLNQVWHCE